MKKISALLCMFLITSAMANPRYVEVQSEKPDKPALSGYSTVLVGKLNLPADLWQTFGYESREAWISVVNDVNNNKFRIYMDELAPDKKIVAPSAGFNGKEGLFVKFAYRGFRHDTGTAFTHRVHTMDVTVTIYDNKSKKQLYTANLGTQTAGVGQRGWMMNSFEGRLDNQIYNLCSFIAGKF